MDEQTRQRFEEAVERKKEESEARSHQHRPAGAPPEESGAIEGDQHSLISDDRKSQDVFSTRDKNSGKGKKTADKWNQ